MPQQDNHLNFHKIIPGFRIIAEKQTQANEFWVVFMHGRSYRNRRYNRLYRELFFINSCNDSYYISKWDKESIIQVDIEEERTFLFPVGSIVDSMGKLIQIPEAVINQKKGVYLYKNIFIDSTKYHHKKSVYKLFEYSNLPCIKNIEVYNEYPHYKVYSKDVKATFIIPIHVILDYFYYLSTGCIYQIINGVFIRSIQEPKRIEDGSYIVPYFGNCISEVDAKALSKFYFMTNTNNPLKYIYNNLYKELLNSRDYFYFDAKIPFEPSILADLYGIYISNKDEKGWQKFLVLGIKDFTLRNKEKFNVPAFQMLNLADTRSLRSTNQLNKQKYYKNIIRQYGGELEEAYGKANNKIKPITNTEAFSRSRFLDSPQITVLDKESQKANYIPLENVVKEINAISLEARNQYSGNTQNAKYNPSEFDGDYKFELFIKLVEEIFTELEDFSFSFINIYPSGSINSYLGYDFVVVNIVYNSKHYYLVDYGSGFAMGFFRHQDIYKQVSNDILKKIVTRIVKEFHVDWTKVFYNKKYFAIYNIHQFKPLRHIPKIILNNQDKIKMKKSLLKRIIDRICDDN